MWNRKDRKHASVRIINSFSLSRYRRKWRFRAQTHNLIEFILTNFGIGRYFSNIGANAMIFPVHKDICFSSKICCMIEAYDVAFDRFPWEYNALIEDYICTFRHVGLKNPLLLEKFNRSSKTTYSYPWYILYTICNWRLAHNPDVPIEFCWRAIKHLLMPFIS